MKRKRPCLAGLAVLALSAVPVATIAADPALPPGLIFFAAGTTCPAGSAPAAAAAGRLLLALTDEREVGKVYGQPLAIQEDRTHTHAGTMSVALPSHHIAGASGGGNGQATGKESHAVALTSGAATTGLPFIQLLVCEASPEVRP